MYKRHNLTHICKVITKDTTTAFFLFLHIYIFLIGEADDQSKPLGVEYYVKCWVGNNEEDKGHKRNSVSLAIKKLQFAPQIRGANRLPSSLVSKGFTFSSGKINLEVTLDKDIYYHGEKIAANLIISNNSRKQVRNIKVYVVQHCEVSIRSFLHNHNQRNKNFHLLEIEDQSFLCP